MLGTSERLKSLKQFKSIHVKKIKFQKGKYDLTYHPILGLFRITPIDGEIAPAGFAISADSLMSKTSISPVSKKDNAELMAWEARLAWTALTKKEKQEITNKMPLNSLFLAGDTIH